MVAKLKPAIFSFFFKSVLKCIKVAKNVINSGLKCLSTSFSEKIGQIASILAAILTAESVCKKMVAKLKPAILEMTSELVPGGLGDCLNTFLSSCVGQLSDIGGDRQLVDENNDINSSTQNFDAHDRVNVRPNESTQNFYLRDGNDNGDGDVDCDGGSGSSQLGLGDCDCCYFSLDLGEIVPKFTLNFNSRRFLRIVYCVKLYKVCYNIEGTWFRSCTHMNRIMIDVMLLRQCIEINPGPVTGSVQKSNVSVRTYNCNGLGVINKFRRILIKIRGETGSGGIVLLQETHIKNEKIIDTYWKGGYVSSCISTNSAGVMILFGGGYECIEKSTDAGGRFAVAVLESDIIKVIVANVYCPNDHVDSKVFMENVYDKIYEIMDRHTDAFLILGGDFNACMSANDSMNRAGSANERLLTDYIKANNSTCEIMDSYRSVESSAGYTWTRQACQSRLDYIFVSQYLTSRITRVEVSYSFEQSDHAAVMVEMHVNEDIKVGPGLTKVNSAVLSDPVQLLAVKAEISEMMGQIPVEWDPHQRLEFLKVAIRTTVSEAVGRDRGELRKSIAEIEESLDDMHKLKCKACAVVNVVERDNKVGLITNAIDRLANDLALLREKQSAATSFKSRARWFDQGEKSNKYFLNLNKKYSKKKIIDRIKCDNIQCCID